MNLPEERSYTRNRVDVFGNDEARLGNSQQVRPPIRPVVVMAAGNGSCGGPNARRCSVTGSRSQVRKYAAYRTVHEAFIACPNMEVFDCVRDCARIELLYFCQRLAGYRLHSSARRWSRTLSKHTRLRLCKTHVGSLIPDWENVQLGSAIGAESGMGRYVAACSPGRRPGTTLTVSRSATNPPYPAGGIFRCGRRVCGGRRTSLT